MRLRSLKPFALAGGIMVAGPAVTNSAMAKVEGGTVILGSAISFTGKYSTKGISATNGYNLAVKKINDFGGIKVGGKSYKLKIKFYDDGSTPEHSARLMERLIRHDRIKFMLGPYGLATTKAVASITEKYKIPMVEAEASSHALFTQGYKYLFAVLSTSKQYLASVIPLAAEVAVKNGKKPQDLRLALIFENDPFSLDVRAGVVDDASKFGMKIVISELMPRDLSDISAILAKIQALRPDVLLISGHSKGAVTAARQIKEMKIDVPMIAMTDCEEARVIARFGASANGFLCPIQWAKTLRYKDSMFGTAANYDDLFKTTFNGYRKAPFQAAQATAAVMVWKDALERANSFDIEKVRAALATTNMKTFYGSIKFSPQGNNLAKPMVLRQIQNGKLNVVAPSRWASHRIRWPRRASGL